MAQRELEYVHHLLDELEKKGVTKAKELRALLDELAGKGRLDEKLVAELRMDLVNWLHLYPTWSRRELEELTAMEIEYLKRRTGA